MRARLEVGDRVKIYIPQDSRGWGYNYCPDGTPATIEGFAEIAWGRENNLGIPPGIYANHFWVNLLLDDGRRHTEFSQRLVPVDSAVYLRSPRNIDEQEFLRPLPDLPFWEGDTVTTKISLSCPGPYMVQSINYRYLGQQRLDGSPMPLYNISNRLDVGWHTALEETDLELVARGKYWQDAHHGA